MKGIVGHIVNIILFQCKKGYNSMVNTMTINEINIQ